MNLQKVNNPHLIRQDGDWVLLLERHLPHPPVDVWDALTQAGRIPSWGPFTTDKDLTSTGPVRLAHINMPDEDVRQGYVLEVDAPRLLVFRWGDDVLRWELIGGEDHTVLVLRHRFADREQAPSYAAGWHLCLEGLAGTLAGRKMPSMVGHDAVKHGYKELYAQYAELLGKDET